MHFPVYPTFWQTSNRVMSARLDRLIGAAAEVPSAQMRSSESRTMNCMVFGYGKESWADFEGGIGMFIILLN
jgi:hypothetical protein